MRIAFVVPRYGVDAAGGAEILTQGFAEHLRSDGTDVEVLTTCARDHFGWENHYPPGDLDVNGIRVRRFEVNRDRDLHLDGDGIIARFRDRRDPGDPVVREPHL